MNMSYFAIICEGHWFSGLYDMLFIPNQHQAVSKCLTIFMITYRHLEKCLLAIICGRVKTVILYCSFTLVILLLTRLQN